MPHKVLTAGDLGMIAATIPKVRLNKVADTWTAALNHLETTEGWRVVSITQGAMTKEPIIVMYKD